MTNTYSKNIDLLTESKTDDPNNSYRKKKTPTKHEKDGAIQEYKK